jgi:iron(III) transport system permease protein
LALPGRRRAPRVLVITSGVIAAALLVPLVFLILQAGQAGWHDVFRLVFRRLTQVLLLNTVQLSVLVSAASAVLGTGAAFLVERTSLPGRRTWAVLVVLPVAVPDFVVGYAWHSMAPALHGLTGATVVMTLAVYPLVYLPEVARSLGLGPVETFFRVTLRQIRPALTGGCLLVCLALLAEYGAFEIMRFQTFTTTIFSELTTAFDLPAASGLSLVLVLLGLIVLAGEAGVNTRGRVSRAGGQTTHLRARHRLRGGRLVAALAGMTALAGAALGVPVGTLVYWMVSSHASTLPGASLWGALEHTATYSAVAALVASVLALPVALLAVRFRSVSTMVLERSTFVVQSLPGLVIALALVFFASHYAHRLYQSATLLEVAYAILFFPLALVCVRASVAQAPRRLEEVGRSLGRPPWQVLLRVTLPLVAPGLAAGFCLVFLSAVTELTATLILVPTGVHTLATQFWAYQSNTSYGAAAPYAVVMVALAAAPGYMLTRWFNRDPGEARA